MTPSRTTVGKLFFLGVALAQIYFADSFLPLPPTIVQRAAALKQRAVSIHERVTVTIPVYAAAASSKGDKEKPKGRLPNTCDSDYDCEGQETCCNFFVFKMCCNDGFRARESDWVPALVPIPVPVDPGYGGNYGGGYGGARGGYGGYNGGGYY